MKIDWHKILSISLPIIETLSILIVGHLITRYVVKLTKRFFARSDRLDVSLERFITKAINISFHLLIIISAISVLGVPVGGLLAALSAAAVAVALALKDSLSNVAGGILLLFSPRFATGDYIAVSDKEGTVVDVDLLHTTIITTDYRRVSIPNGVLVNENITNYTCEQKRRVDITFSISYESDVELAKKLALDVIKSHRLTLNEPALPFARVKSYGESSVNILTRTWCRNEDYWTLYYDLVEQIRVVFDENGISIPYNQLDVRIKNDKND